MELQGQKALVTGASRGIGAAIAIELARGGAEVALLARTLEGLQATAQAIREGGGTAHCYAADVGEAGQLGTAISEAHKQMGRLDILVNNAGILICGSLEDTSLADWHRMLRVNADSVFLGCREGMTLMKDNGGSIINLSSIDG